MKGILDENYNPELEEDKPQNDTIGLILSVIMLIGGAIFIKLGIESGAKASIFQLITVSFIYQIMFVAVGIILSAIVRLIKSPKRKIKIKALINEGVFGGFGLWLLFFFLVLFNKYLS